MKTLIDLVLSQTQRGLPIVRHYHPGLDRIEVLRECGRYGISVSQDLLDAYSYKNGALGREDTPMSDLWMVPPYYWLSLEEAGETRNDLMRCDVPEFADHWLPLFSSGGAAFLVLDLVSGQVLLYDRESEIVGRVLAGSLRSFFGKVHRALEEGEIYLDYEGFLSTKNSFWLPPPA